MNSRAVRNRILPVAAVLIAIVTLISGALFRPRRPAPAPQDRLEAPAPAVGQAMTRTPDVSHPDRPMAAAAPDAPISHPHSVQAGMTIAIDPETGALGPPSAQQWAELKAGLAQVTRSTPENFLEIRRADGAIGLDLRGRLQEYAVVRIGPDGKPVFGCLRPGEDSPTTADSAGAALEVQ